MKKAPRLDPVTTKNATVPYGPMRPFTSNKKLITKEGDVKQPSTKK